MGRFFKLRKHSDATTVRADDAIEDRTRMTRRNVVNTFRKRIGKTPWPSSTTTKLSIQKPSGSTASEDTDEVTEYKFQHTHEFVAEVGTDGGDESILSESDDSSSEAEFHTNLATIEESLHQSKSQQPSLTRNSSAFNKLQSKAISAIASLTKEEKTPCVGTTTPASAHRVTPASSVTPIQTPENQVREKLRQLEALRKTFSSFRANLQDHATNRSSRQSPRTPNAAMSFWCQPELLCSNRTAQHLFPLDDISLPINDSSQTSSTNEEPFNRQAVSFIDNVLDRLVGQDSREDSTAFGTVDESVMDDTQFGESVIFAASISRHQDQSHGHGSTRPTAGQSTRIMETLAEWDELDDELGQYDPTNRDTGESLSFEFSESWGYTDDDETEFTDPSAYTTD